jgi:SpoVK/Ycf46/Vps4 family AAA+-type ATPase
MGFGKQNHDIDNPQNSRRETISYRIPIKDKNVRITFKGAMVTDVNGTVQPVDKVFTDILLDDLINAISRNITKYNPLPKSVVVSYVEEEPQQPQQTKETSIDNTSKDIVRSFEPKWTMDNVCVDDEVRAQIMSTLTIIKHRDKLFDEWGLTQVFKDGRSIVLNFFGPPGTGKTMMAEAIANYLGKRVYSVNYSELESKFVGETPKNIVSVFEKAKDENAVVVFDEADSFLGKRLTNVTQSADYGVNVTRSVMLMEIEKFDGVVIFTTNLISNYDEAFKRRILANIEFKMPDADARTQIWKAHISSKYPIHAEITYEMLGQKYDGISGADIKDMLLNAAVICLQDNKNVVEQSHFDLSYKYIMLRYTTQHANSFMNPKIISVEQITDESMI